MTYNPSLFQKFNKDLKLKALFSKGREIEGVWDEPARRDDFFADFQSMLKILGKEKDTGLHQISSEILKNLETKNLNTLKHEDFTKTYIQLEQQFNCNPTDSEILHLEKLDQLERVSHKRGSLIIGLDHLRSAFNVGAIFRSSECLNVKELGLIGYTPSPDHNKVQKTAMLSEELVPWQQFQTCEDFIRQIKTQDPEYQIFGIERNERNSQSLFELQLPKKLVLLFGNEKHGLSKESLALCDKTVEIPMFGVKNSMNVANCLSICIYEHAKQWSQNARH